MSCLVCSWVLDHDFWAFRILFHLNFRSNHSEVFQRLTFLRKIRVPVLKEFPEPCRPFPDTGHKLNLHKTSWRCLRHIQGGESDRGAFPGIFHLLQRRVPNAFLRQHAFINLSMLKQKIRVCSYH